MSVSLPWSSILVPRQNIQILDIPIQYLAIEFISLEISIRVNDTLLRDGESKDLSAVVERESIGLLEVFPDGVCITVLTEVIGAAEDDSPVVGNLGLFIWVC